MTHSCLAVAAIYWKNGPSVLNWLVACIAHRQTGRSHQRHRLRHLCQEFQLLKYQMVLGCVHIWYKPRLGRLPVLVVLNDGWQRQTRESLASEGPVTGGISGVRVDPWSWFGRERELSSVLSSLAIVRHRLVWYMRQLYTYLGLVKVEYDHYQFWPLSEIKIIHQYGTRIMNRVFKGRSTNSQN